MSGKFRSLTSICRGHLPLTRFSTRALHTLRLPTTNLGWGSRRTSTSCGSDTIRWLQSCQKKMLKECVKLVVLFTVTAVRLTLLRPLRGSVNSPRLWASAPILGLDGDEYSFHKASIGGGLPLNFQYQVVPQWPVCWILLVFHPPGTSSISLPSTHINPRGLGVM